MAPGCLLGLMGCQLVPGESGLSPLLPVCVMALRTEGDLFRLQTPGDLPIMRLNATWTNRREHHQHVRSELGDLLITGSLTHKCVINPPVTVLICSVWRRLASLSAQSNPSPSIALKLLFDHWLFSPILKERNQERGEKTEITCHWRPQWT